MQKRFKPALSGFSFCTGVNAIQQNKTTQPNPARRALQYIFLCRQRDTRWRSRRLNQRGELVLGWVSVVTATLPKATITASLSLAGKPAGQIGAGFVF